MKILRTVLLFLLCISFGFLSGIMIAFITEAGKGQMLAGGAIVFGYGIIGALLGMVLAFVLRRISREKPNNVQWMNAILMVMILCYILFFRMQYLNRQAEKADQIGQILSPSTIEYSKALSLQIA